MDAPRDFAKSFKSFMDQMAASAPVQEAPLLRRVREHLGADPASLAIVSHTFPASDHPNLQRAIDAWVTEPGRSMEVLGISSAAMGFMRVGLAQCVAAADHRGLPLNIGPAQYRDVHIGDDRYLSCLHHGLALLTGSSPMVALIAGPGEMGLHRDCVIEVIARDQADAQAFVNELRSLVRQRNVYRGRVISIGVDQHHNLRVEFHRLPAVAREQIILPTGVLERIERYTVGFSRMETELRAAGRHIKRGMLLYGPPGTGKTFTATHLAARMPERTVLLVTGRTQGLIESTCAMARALQPSTVILEDVDLIGVARDQRSEGCATPLLFELMNQMDGLGEDADVLFILTTNRPDVLEPALASRPGRIDQAVEVPLPDAECRRRLFDLYAKGLTLHGVDVDSIVKRTHGASAAFMRELLRRAAMIAADVSPAMIVTNRELDEAIHELTIHGGPLMRNLLGFASSSGEDELE